MPYPDDELWSRVCSEADACHGLRCPNREDCFVLKARREAAAARILVANHHLLFADLGLRLAGTGFEAAAVLPPFQHIVFDEAHNIEKNATSYFSAAVQQGAGSQVRRPPVPGKKAASATACSWAWSGPWAGGPPGCAGTSGRLWPAPRSLELAARPLLDGRQAVRFTAKEAALLGAPGGAGAGDRRP